MQMLHFYYVLCGLKYFVFAVTRHFCFVLGRQAGSEFRFIQLQKYNTYTSLKRKQRKKIRTFYNERKGNSGADPGFGVTGQA